MHSICIKYAYNMYKYAFNMHQICIKYAENMMQKIRHYIDFNVANMQMIFKKNMQKICSICNKNMQKRCKIYMQNMHKSIYWHILHIMHSPLC